MEASRFVLSWSAQCNSCGCRPDYVRKGYSVLFYTAACLYSATFLIYFLITLHYVVYIKNLHSLRTSNLANLCRLATGSEIALKYG